MVAPMAAPAGPSGAPRAPPAFMPAKPAAIGAVDVTMLSTPPSHAFLTAPVSPFSSSIVGRMNCVLAFLSSAHLVIPSPARSRMPLSVSMAFGVASARASVWPIEPTTFMAPRPRAAPVPARKPRVSGCAASQAACSRFLATVVCALAKKSVTPFCFDHESKSRPDAAPSLA